VFAIRPFVDGPTLEIGNQKTGKTAVAPDKLRNCDAMKLRNCDAMKRAKDNEENAAQATAEEVANQLGCASGWLPEYLEWLGVDFDVSKEHDMLTLLKTKDIRCAWTDEHDKSMDNLLKKC
jgi:DNA-binding transcriptional regulator GbsR (MarR family)